MKLLVGSGKHLSNSDGVRLVHAALSFSLLCSAAVCDSVEYIHEVSSILQSPNSNMYELLPISRPPKSRIQFLCYHTFCRTRSSPTPKLRNHFTRLGSAACAATTRIEANDLVVHIIHTSGAARGDAFPSCRAHDHCACGI